MRPRKPVFQSVLDLGLRDIGVRNEPRRLAAHFGKRSLPLLLLVVVFVVAGCAILRASGANAWLVAAFALAWTTAVFALAFRAVKRSPVTVVKVTAEGANQAAWLLIAPFVLLALAAVLAWDPVTIPVVVLGLIVPVLAWRARGRVPALLRELRPLIAADEPVLGDGLGVAHGARRGHAAVRVIVATDRRLLVTAPERPPVVDAPYRRVTRFGFEWKTWGRVGELSVTVAGVDGAASETHVVTAIAPANLLSVARALHAHGVEADDPAALADAERAWEEAQGRGRSQGRRLDRAGMRTPEFDRGLWLLLGLCAAIFYVNPFGIGIGASSDGVPALLAVPVLGGICGYVSRTRSSLAYLVPLNLLVAPAFFFADAGDVIGLMVVVGALAAVGLWVGSALPRPNPADPGRRPARGSLRDAVSGLRLVRLSGVLLGGMVALVAAAGAAGFEPTTLRQAVEEVTAEQRPVDGRSNLNGNAASLTYTPGRDLHEFITDEAPLTGPNDGARWELRTSFTKGYNVLTLTHYIFDDPRLDDAAAVADFIADKDRDHARLAGSDVTHTKRVVDGRTGYVWTHGSRRGYWYYAAWFPQPDHSVRVECIAKRQTSRFKRLCAQAMRSLEFH